MGFGGGGGSGALPSHVHNNVPLQGGPLDFANDTIASLTAGSTTFSDGAALQELLLGNPADSLVVNGAGTAPEWVAAAGGGIWEFVEEFVLGSTTVDFDCVLASAIQLDEYVARVDWVLKNDTISSNMEMVFNGQSGAAGQVFISGNTAQQGMVCSGFVQIPADSWCIGSFQYFGNDEDTSTTMGFFECSHGTTGSGNLSGTPYRGTFRLQGATTEISAVKFFPTNGNQYIRNYVRVYRMKVN
jgi:hypothetical protein